MRFNLISSHVRPSVRIKFHFILTGNTVKIIQACTLRPIRKTMENLRTENLYLKRGLCLTLSKTFPGDMKANALVILQTLCLFRLF